MVAIKLQWIFLSEKKINKKWRSQIMIENRYCIYSMYVCVFRTILWKMEMDIKQKIITVKEKQAERQSSFV